MHGTENHVFKRLGDMFVDRIRLRRLGRCVHGEQVHSLAVERELAGCEAKECHAECVDIGSTIDRALGPNLFGRGGHGRCVEAARFSVGVVGILRETEVEEHRLIVGTHQHVRRLHVPVNDTSVMAVLQRVAERRCQLHGRGKFEWATHVEHSVEGGTIDPFHLDEQDVSDAARLVGLDDARMIELRKRVELSGNCTPEVGVAHGEGRQDLDRNVYAIGATANVHRCRCTLSEHVSNVIRSESSTDRDRREHAGILTPLLPHFLHRSSRPSIARHASRSDRQKGRGDQLTDHFVSVGVRMNAVERRYEIDLGVAPVSTCGRRTESVSDEIGAEAVGGFPHVGFAVEVHDRDSIDRRFLGRSNNARVQRIDEPGHRCAKAGRSASLDTNRVLRGGVVIGRDGDVGVGGAEKFGKNVAQVALDGVLGCGDRVHVEIRRRAAAGGRQKQRVDIKETCGGPADRHGDDRRVELPSHLDLSLGLTFMVARRIGRLYGNGIERIECRPDASGQSGFGVGIECAGLDEQLCSDHSIGIAFASIAVVASKEIAAVSTEPCGDRVSDRQDQRCLAGRPRHEFEGGVRRRSIGIGRLEFHAPLPRLDRFPLEPRDHTSRAEHRCEPHGSVAHPYNHGVTVGVGHDDGFGQCLPELGAGRGQLAKYRRAVCLGGCRGPLGCRRRRTRSLRIVRSRGTRGQKQHESSEAGSSRRGGRSAAKGHRLDETYSPAGIIPGLEQTRSVDDVLVRLIGKNLLQRPLRYALTGFAIVFSVAAVSAVFIFTDGLRTTFDELATNIESGYDISVRPSLEFGDDFLAPSVPVDQLDVIAAVDGVRSVQPRVVGLGVIAVDGAGEPTLASSGPNLGVHWGARGQTDRLFVQSGRPPVDGSEFALDVDAFADGEYTLGEQYVVQVPTSIEAGRTFTLVGTFTFADPDRNALVGARLVAFDEDTAVELLNGGRGYSDITLTIEAGVNIDEIVSALAAVVAENLEVLTQEEVLEETQGDFGQILDIFRTVLLVFAIIILFVSSFLIYNVFSITLGQRIRELGLLRAVGALGSQVTALMIGEALLLGVAATIVGIPSGVGVAWLLRAALNALGFPDDTGLPLSGWTVLWAVFTGVVVTLLAAIWPSIQARRVAPLSALRDGADLTDLRTVRNTPLGIAAVILGVVTTVSAFLFDGWLPRFFLPLIGATLLYVGALLIHKRLAQFTLFPIGIALLVVTLLGSFTLGETFGLLGAGALVTLLGANQLNPLLARPLTRVLGALPTAVAIALIGVGFVLTGVASLIGGVAVLVSGVPDSVVDATGSDVGRAPLAIPALVGAVIAPVIGYGMIRTARGGLGLTGQVARSNAARNPQRTATTAAALMIGLTLVTAVTVIGDSIKSSVSDALSSSITADWLISGPSAGPNQIPFATAVRERIDSLDEVESVVAYRSAFPAAWVTSESGELRAEDFQQFLPIVLQLLDDDSELRPAELLALRDELGTDVEINDAIAVDYLTLDTHIDPGFIDRDPLLVGPNAVYLVDDVAEEKGLRVGDTFSALFIDLQSEDLVVAGIYENGFVLGPRTMSLEMWDRHFPSDADQFLTAVTASGVTPDVARAAIVSEIEEDFPIIEVQDRTEFAEASERQINQTLATVNVLLGLSAVIAALGILVALALSVFERTREIGLFRAVGTTRSQTRWMIRWEGVIVASFGGLLGVILGVALGALATAKMPEILVTKTTVPVGTLAGYVLFAAVIGLAAAVFPAWIAGRLDVLDSIGAE